MGVDERIRLKATIYLSHVPHRACLLGDRLSFKKKRDIVNRSYQTRADNIVGVMTMATLDKEMLESEKAARSVRTISCRVSSGAASGGRT